MSEAPIMRRIQLELAKYGLRLFRNNVGMLTDAAGNKVRYGLCNGSSDLIGLTPVVITPEMVGRRVAIFTAIEVKDKTKLTAEQQNFINFVLSAGGIAFKANSEAEAVKLYKTVEAVWKTK